MQDLRLAVRALRATPIVSTVAVLSLGLGIGANTAIFSLVSSVMLRSLPVATPERLAILTSGPFANRAWSYAIWDELRQRQQLFDGAIAWVPMRRAGLQFSTSAGNDPRRSLRSVLALWQTSVSAIQAPGDSPRSREPSGLTA